MEQISYEMKLPQAMVYFMAANAKKNELERNALMLYPYIKDLTISYGRAAEILGIHKQTLIDLYGDMGISYIDCDISVIQNDMATFEQLEKTEK